MRHTSFLLIASLLTAASAAPQLEQTKRDVEMQRRYVGVWDSHEQDIAYEARLEELDSTPKGRKGRGRKHWWKWHDEDSDDEEEKPKESSSSSSSSSPSTSTSSTKDSVTLPVERPTPEVLPPDSKDKSAEDITFLPILDEDGKIKQDPEPSTFTSTLSSTTTRSITAKPSNPTPAPSQPTKVVALKPTYPSSIDDPVPKDAWLLQLAGKLSPYWNYTEVLWEPCERYNKKYPTGADCKPSCEDIHSHTRLAVFNDCIRYEICAFATFVLPDSECPDRPNSFKLRCPQSEEELKVKTLHKMTHGLIPPAGLQSMLDGKSKTIEQCIAEMNVAPATRRSLPRRNTRALTIRDTNTALALPSLHSLQKRGYEYRGYLNGLNMYRSVLLTGPPDFYGKWDLLPDGGYSQDPFDCSEIARTVFMEDIYLNGTQYSLCSWPETTRDMPEERCPGVGGPVESCPGSEEELVQFFFDKMSGKKTKDEIKAMLKNETESNKPCTEDMNSDSLYCRPPRRKRAVLTPLPL